MARNISRAVGYKAPSVDVFPKPRRMKRAPLVTDIDYPDGQLWIYVQGAGTDDVYILATKRGGQAAWLNMGGGNGSFNSLAITTTAIIGTTLTVGGTTTLNLAAGTVRSSAAGVISALADGVNGEVLIGTTGGVPAWSTLTAGGGITIAEAAGTITISNPGATGTTFGTDVGGPVSPDGAGLTTIRGIGANLSTDGSIANTIDINLADNIVSVASITATADFDVLAGTTTILSNTNAADAIILQADAGVNETVRMISAKGTGTGSVTLLSAVGGISLVGGLDGDAINIATSHANGRILIGAGTGGIATVIADGPFSVGTGVGDISIGIDLTDHNISIGSLIGTSTMYLASGTGGFGLESTGVVAIDSDGTMEINSSGGSISIGHDNIDQNINLGTQGDRDITIGNATGTTGVYVDCGTAGATFGTTATAHTTTIGGTTGGSALTLQAGTGALTATAGGICDLNAVGNVTIDSTGGTLGLGEGADANNINIGTGAAARILTLGNVTAATSVVLNVGTGNLDLGVSATAHTTRLGSTSGASDSVIQAGTGALTVTAGGILDINGTGDLTVDLSAGAVDVSVTGNIAIDSSAGTIGIGVDDIDQVINIGTNGERVITVGNQVGAAGMVLESGTAGMALNALGLATVECLVDTQAAAAVTINANQGVGTFTGLTTAAAASQVLTVTNSICTAGSAILCSLSNLGANDAQCCVTRIVPAAGSFTVTYQNLGAASLNGNLILTFWILVA